MMSPCNKPMMNNYNKPMMNACNNVSMNTCDSIVEKTCSCEDEIIYIDVEKNNCFQNPCSTYVSPMYNMAPMQCMGNFTNKYPSLDDNMMSPYSAQDDDMWMSYYMYMQQMMQPMPYNK